MKILFFDTETTGLPKNWKAPVHQLDNWPRLVQIAWQVYDSNGNLLEEHDYVIKPVGFIISIEASAVHKITTEKALEIGVDLLTILKAFSSSVNGCGLLVAHNYSYDYNIMGAELLRNGIENSLYEKEHICTMNASTDFCKIPGPYGYKWPKLEELYKILFDESFNAHNALDDIRATTRCFWKLSSLNVIKFKLPTNKPENSSNEIKQWGFSDFGEDLKILIFSAKGDGLPKKLDIPPEHIQNWPRLESIAWEVYNQDGKRIGKGIYENLLSLENGKEEQERLLADFVNSFSKAIEDSNIIVAHNYSLNYSIVAAQLNRPTNFTYVNFGDKLDIKTSTKLKEKLHICTMESSNIMSSSPGQTTSGSNVVDIVDATAKLFLELKTKEKLKRPVKYINDKIHGKLKGVTYKFNDNDVIETTVNYVKGKKQGLEVSIETPKALRSKTNYLNDLKNGIEEKYSGGYMGHVESYNEFVGTFWEEKYIDSYIASSISYINGKKHGEEKKYYNSNILESLKNWINNKQHGEEKEYYESGKLMRTVNWIDDKRNGEEKEYYESGVLKRRTMYNSTLYEISQVITNFSTVGKRDFEEYVWDRKHGEEKEYYETEVLKSVVNYFNGDKKGVYKEFYESGLLKMTVNYGLITYYDKWLKKGMGHTYFKKQGEEKEFYESGILMRTVNYIDGEKDGEEKLFYKNGVLKESKTWWGRDMGDIYGWKSRKYGEERIFNESGQLKKLIIHAKKTKLPKSGIFGLEPNWPHNYFTEGNAKELEKEFYESGEIEIITHYFEGKKSGEVKSFRKNGQIRGVQNYVKGKWHGEAISYYESENLDESPPIYSIIQWSKSKENGKAEIFYKSGVLQESSTFTNGLRKGEAKIFYESGALKYLACFDGYQVGVAKVFYESGALKVIIPEEKDGEGKIFYETGELESIINLKAGKPTNNVGYYKSGELKWEQSYDRIYSSQAGGGRWHSLKTYDKLGELDDSIQLDSIYLEHNWRDLFKFYLYGPKVFRI